MLEELTAVIRWWTHAISFSLMSGSVIRWWTHAILSFSLMSGSFRFEDPLGKFLNFTF